MMIRMVCLVCVAMPLAVPLPPVKENPKRMPRDEERIQGAWQVTTAEVNGRVEQNQFVGAKLVVQGASFSFAGTKNFTFKLDASKNPKELEFTAVDGMYANQTNPGIYHLEGDTLKLCLPNHTTKDRPREFAAPANSNLLFMTLKRMPK